MAWHVVELVAPLDWFEDCSVALDQFIAKRQRDGEFIAEMTEALHAYGAARKSAQLRHEPRVWFDPFSDHWALLVKEDNNGNTYLVVRDPQPYMRLNQG